MAKFDVNDDGKDELFFIANGLSVSYKLTSLLLVPAAISLRFRLKKVLEKTIRLFAYYSS